MEQGYAFKHSVVSGLCHTQQSSPGPGELHLFLAPQERPTHVLAGKPWS